MSTGLEIRHQSLQFELKFSQLQRRLEIITEPSSPQMVSKIFTNLVESVRKARKSGTLNILSSVLDDNKLLSSSQTKNPSIFIVHALKSIQYGLTVGWRNRPCKDEWRDLSEVILKAKIEKLQKKVTLLLQDAKLATSSPTEESVGTKKEISLVPQEEDVQRGRSRTFGVLPSVEEREDKSAMEKLKGSLSRAKGKVARMLSDSGISTVASFGSFGKNSQSKKSHSHPPSLFSVFSLPNGENPDNNNTSLSQISDGKVEITIAQENQICPEVFFWNEGILTDEPNNSPEILVKFNEELMSFLKEDCEYTKFKNGLQWEDQILLLRSAVTYLNEIFFRMQKDFILLGQEREKSKSNPGSSEFQGEAFDRSFVAYSYLIHLYAVSLELDTAYIYNKWAKPQIVDMMETLLHLEKPLFALIPEIEKMPILRKHVKGKFSNAEATLAYHYLRNKVESDDNVTMKNRWLTQEKFKKHHQKDPLKSTGLGHRSSPGELPKWMQSWIGERKSNET